MTNQKGMGSSKKPSPPPPEAPARETPAIVELTNPPSRMGLVVGISVAVAIVVVAIIGFFLWPRESREPPSNGSAPAPQEAVGPKTILEAVSALQDNHKVTSGSFLGDLSALVDEGETNPASGISVAAFAAIRQHIAASNLCTRVVGSGYEIAIRRDAQQWLVYSWSKNAGKKVGPVQSADGPPFPVPPPVPRQTAAAEPPPVPPTDEAPKPAPAQAVKAPQTADAASSSDTSKVTAPQTGTAAVAATAAKPLPLSKPQPAPKAEELSSARKGPEVIADIPKEPPDPNWRWARAMLKNSGVMKSGNQYVAIINDKLVRKGDVVAVTYKGRVYEFLVKSIDTRNIEYEPILDNTEEPDEADKPPAP